VARIFIADDDPDVRLVMTHALVQEGHEVAVADDGASALEAIVADPPDLVILDLMMPGLDAFAALEAIRNLGLALIPRVMVLSARSSEHLREQGYEAGADLYMAKPFDSDELVQNVAEVLSATSLELAARRQLERDRAHLLSQLEDAFGDS
jgi:DNA-binding response OmpR family regulator